MTNKEANRRLKDIAALILIEQGDDLSESLDAETLERLKKRNLIHQVDTKKYELFPKGRQIYDLIHDAVEERLKYLF